MEDLVPLIFFLVIVGVNVLKFFIEKGGKARKASEQSGESPPKRASRIETFFEELAEQMAPKPTELADWPEGLARPNYAEEMEEFQQEQAEAIKPTPDVVIQEPSLAAIIQMPMRQGSSFQLKGGSKTLRQAMLAHIVFSPPRALDDAYSDTLADYN